MALSAREIRMIETLLRHPDGLTVADLADRLGVSARTVHRELRPASEFLDSHGLVLRRRAGRGVRVEGTAGARERALEALRDAGSADLTPQERKLSLLRRLLGAEEPVKLRALASGLGVSVGTVGRDLDEVEDWLADFGLSLLRKRGYGVEVVGSEADLRRAMSRLILENLDEAALFPLSGDRAVSGSTESSTERISERLMGMVDEERLRLVEGLTGAAVQRLPYAIADSAFVGLSVHVALMVERLLQGRSLELDEDTVRRLRDTVEYEHASGLARAIEKEFRADVPEAEVAYITMHLRGTKLDQDALERYFEATDLEMASRVKALIHFVGEQTGVPLVGDSSLYTGLLAHLERALHRLREDMRIHNPLLSEIKEDYPALFELVDSGMKRVFADEEIPAEEVGFVAMHFGAALDRGQGTFPRSVLVICPAGIGSARMLASRLEKTFPQIRRITNTSLSDLERLDPDGFDLVVSTVALPVPEWSYVQVRPLLSESEAERIKDHLRENLGKRLGTRPAERAASESLEVFGGGQARFAQMAEATQVIAELVEDFFLTSHDAGGSVPEAVRLMCASLVERGLLREPGRLEDALLSRVQRGGIGIPGTALALFHARSDAVVRPSFSAHDFDEPLEIEGMDGAMMQVRRSLLMVAPLELSPVALEAISEISVAMVEQPAEREVFERGPEGRIAAVLDGVFARYLQQKLT